MSTEQTRRTLNHLDKDIAVLEKKSADYEKKIALAQNNANRVAKSISKNATSTTIKSKYSQIDRYKGEAIKVASVKADINNKIADKQKQRLGMQERLQREEGIERKKSDTANTILLRNYEQRVDELTLQLNNQTIPTVQSHIYSETNSEKYDVFISYASEDKENIADKLFHELKSLGVKVWYDTVDIQWGDSLRSKIDAGLRNSMFGIVILSNDYIRKGWTQYELDGLFQQEMMSGKTILPIWHRITMDEVQTFSPTLAGRKALNTTMCSVEEIADKLIKLLPAVMSKKTEDTQNE
jgi:hypothetical protein